KKLSLSRRNLNAEVFEHFYVVEDAPGLEVDRVSVPFALIGHIAHVTGCKAQILDDLIASQVLYISFFNQVRVKSGISHHDLVEILCIDRGIQLRPIVGTLRVSAILKLDNLALFCEDFLCEKLLDYVH